MTELTQRLIAQARNDQIYGAGMAMMYRERYRVCADELHDALARGEYGTARERAREMRACLEEMGARRRQVVSALVRLGGMHGLSEFGPLGADQHAVAGRGGMARIGPVARQQTAGFGGDR